MACGATRDGRPLRCAWATLPYITIESLADLGRVLRELRRRHARQTGGAELTYRQLAAATGWSHGIIGEYLAGKVLPPTERFDVLIRLFGATPAEQGALATARDRIEERRRRKLPGAGVGELPPPRQLPADVAGFTGRVAQLARLDACLDTDAGPVLPIIAVSGPPGVGKTALVVHWAHRVAARFPDGQLYLDLRGYDPQRPIPPATALAGCLRALGLDPALMPRSTAERAAAYRSLLADRRMLVVLDNAQSAEQARPLLPGTGPAAVVVTSRDDLAGLVAREGAHRIPLAPLPRAEAAGLFSALAGGDVPAEIAAEIADRCGRLPLAIRVAGEIAAAHPDLAPVPLLAQLSDQQRRLEFLDAAGDRRTAIRAVFSWSYERLPTAAARAFGLLGLHPGDHFDVYQVAALAGSATTEPATRVLDELRRAHLVEPAGPGRYRMHDLLRAYAGERAAGGDQPRQARSRLWDHYVSTAVRATSALFPHDRRPAVPGPPTPIPPVHQPEAARRWLDAQRTDLVAAGEYAASHGWPEHCVALSEALWRYLEVGGHYQEALALHTAAVAAARRHGRGAAAVLANLGGTHWWLGRYRDALDCYERSRSGYRVAGDRDGEAHALARLGVVHERLGDYPTARRHLREALALYRATGNRHGEGAQLVNLGALYRRLGRHEESAAHQSRAAAVFARLGDRRLEGYALGNLGAVYSLLGRDSEGLAELRTALRLCRESNDRGGEGSALSALGAIHARLAQHAEALDHLHRALVIHRETADRGVEAETLNTLGETLLDLGEPEAAIVRHRAALALARQTGDRYEQARALAGTAAALAALGRGDQAAGPLREAREIRDRLGVPEAGGTRDLSKVRR